MGDETTATAEQKVPKFEPVEPTLIDLPKGKELTEPEAREITIARCNRLVVIAGPASCGKTTLLVSLYELFQWESVPGWLFSGCDTLQAFELRCHPSRVASERDKAYTERTLNIDDQVRYLHLQVCPSENPQSAVDFLFTDIAGELFEHARDSDTGAKQMGFVLQADHFVLLLDGEKIARPTRRHEAVKDGRMLLQSLLDSRMLGPNSFVEVLFTKCDYFEDPAIRDEVRNFCASVTQDFTKRFAARLGRLLFFGVAARPERDSGLQMGHGLPEMLGRWIASSPRLRPVHLAHAPLRGGREIDAFFARQVGKIV